MLYININFHAQALAVKHFNYALPKSTPIKTREIFEIYPNAQGQRNLIFFSDKSKSDRNKFRSDECPVCLESFLDLKNSARINLFCGHSICPCCLTELLYLSNQSPKCPLCRDSINKSEFSTNYSDFTKHIDFNRIINNHSANPAYKSKLCALFGYCS